MLRKRERNKKDEDILRNSSGEGMDSLRGRPSRDLRLCLVIVFSCFLLLSITMANVLGGVTESERGQNSAEIEELARFAVDEHNKKENALLEYVRVLKAKEQVVAGKLHHLTVEVIDAGKKKLYEAKVWVQPWLNSRELKEFNHVDDSVSLTTADLGAKREAHGSGWRVVPAHDPVVKDAANHAVQAIQQRSNCLFPYELLDIVDAKAEVIEDVAKFDMLLKLKNGRKETKFKVEVHKNLEGTFQLNQFQEHAESANE